jgi:hypothetical protein
MTRSKYVSQLLKERQSLSVMALCSQLLAMMETLFIYFQFDCRSETSLSLRWVVLGVFICINVIIGCVVDIYWLKSKALIIWSWTFFILFVLFIGRFVIQPASLMFWFSLFF